MINFTPDTSGRDTDGPRGRVYPDTPYLRKVDDQAIVANANSRGVVSSAANSDPEAIIASERTEWITSAASAQRIIGRGCRAL
jgi:hypothetical protein